MTTINDGPSKTLLSGVSDHVVRLLRDAFDAVLVQGTITDDGYRLGIVKRILDEPFQLREACGVVVSNVLVNKDDFIVD